jgi:phospholipid/cholesterol/gamma-HCH transport system permease protein
MEAIEEQHIFKSYLKKKFTSTGDSIFFAARFFKELFRGSFQWQEFLNQCYIIGYKSFPLIGITGFIMGLVLTLQSRPSLAEFGAESLLPGMVSNSLVIEIGPVITALICAGNIGSRIGAELGSMKVTEQIDAMEVSAINPYKYLVVTRVLATTFMIPLLVIYTDAIGFFGGYIAMNIHSDISFFHFFSAALARIYYTDIMPALIKSVFFGFAIGIIGCYKGYRVTGGTESVGRAANSAVVSASLAVFVIDMIAVQITDLFQKHG